MFDLNAPGKIEIATDKELYVFEEIVKIGVRLEMTEPKKARGLRVSLLATRTMPRRHGHTERTEVVYASTLDLEKEGEYAGARIYSAEMRIPPYNSIESSLGKGIVSLVGGLTGIDEKELRRRTTNSTKWDIKATLDIPSGIDINGEKRILVRLSE